MSAAVAVRAYDSWPAARAAAGAWAREAGAMLVCPELPLLGAYSVAKNLSLVRQLQAHTADWRARPLALATLERAGMSHLAALPAETLDPRDTLAVKCLAAAMQPHGRVAVVCGGHMSDGAAEAATIRRLVRLFVDRWRRCEIFIEESRAGLLEVV